MKMKDFALYAITCPPPAGRTHAQMAEEAVRGGVDVLQLRDKTLSDVELLKTAVDLARICRKSGVLFLVNDRPDIALLSGADGVHLGQDDLPIAAARGILGREALVGRSTHSLKQALAAQSEGADYIGVGPVFATPTKPDYGSVGLELVRQAADQITIPFVAIGGIDLNNISSVLEAGARRIAAVRAICGAPDIAQAARTFKEAVSSGVAVRSF